MQSPVLFSSTIAKSRNIVCPWVISLIFAVVSFNSRSNPQAGLAGPNYFGTRTSRSLQFTSADQPLPPSSNEPDITHQLPVEGRTIVPPPFMELV